ncbi:MAG: tRNA (adenosine(37)-N6)-threonylcarbamoyltransferase complex transferase subunit TsaD [Verrucomicrobiota bacterium]|nr:tRNA (adenosine(37)-N6)-threonylcarbamoyltransferase complex transferase subunit TsaD [Verrucomicrobiota bacterium]
MLVLGLETSCDETSAALVEDGCRVLSNVVSSQIEKHAKYGGVVPEIASRDHLKNLSEITKAALSKAGKTFHQIDVVAATKGPGLASSLLIGLTAGKALSVSLGKPFVAVNHLEGHLISPLLETRLQPDQVYPNLSLVVSGGHTLLLLAKAPHAYEVVAKTLDDAAGEAFDKIAKLLCLEYPGGPVIDRLAQRGNPERYSFPRSMKDNPSAFSFSGLKTNVRYFLEKNPEVLTENNLPDLCASVQEAIVDVLVEKVDINCRVRGVKVVTLSGGVSCNTRLRARMQRMTELRNLRLYLSPPNFSTDNAAMIAAVGYYMMTSSGPSPLTTEIVPSMNF